MWSFSVIYLDPIFSQLIDLIQIIKKVAKKPAADEAPKAGDEKEKTASAEKTAEAGDSSGKAEG